MNFTQASIGAWQKTMIHIFSKLDKKHLNSRNNKIDYVIGAAVAFAPNRYNRVHLHTVSLNYAHGKGCACSSLKGVSLHCIIFRTATDPACGSGVFLVDRG